MARNSSKANHYVSKCYLEGFSSPTSEGKLWRYGYHQGSRLLSVDLVRPKNEAFVNNFYDLNPSQRAQLEDYFGAVENWFPSTREKLNNFRPISAGDILVLTLMLGIHHVRNPSWAADIEKHVTTVQAVIEELKTLDHESQRTILANVNAEWKTDLDFEGLLASLRSDRLTALNGRVERLRYGLGRLLPLLAEKFSKLSWKFLISPPEEPFITSDNPFLWHHSGEFKMVFAHNEDPSNQLPVEMLMPISPKIAAVGMALPGMVDRPSSERISSKTCKDLNDLIIRNRTRYVYADRNSSDLCSRIEALESQRLR
jgi:hypothetical protein